MEYEYVTGMIDCLARMSFGAGRGDASRQAALGGSESELESSSIRACWDMVLVGGEEVGWERKCRGEW